MILNERIRAFRVAIRLSQARLAAALGVERVAAHRWEKANVRPCEKSLIALARLARGLRHFDTRDYFLKEAGVDISWFRYPQEGD